MKHNARPITSRSRFQPADSPAKYNADLVQGADAMYRAGAVKPITRADITKAEEPVEPAEPSQKQSEPTAKEQVLKNFEKDSSTGMEETDDLDEKIELLPQ